MTNSKSSFTAKRTTRRRFAQSMRRCIGLERLEKRTVFASDLGADLESQLFACSANEMQPQATVQPTSELPFRSESELSIYQASTPNLLTEVASSTVSLENGDLIAIEVPTSSFDYLQFNGQYLLTYSYAQNYFSDAGDQALGTFGSLAQYSAIDSGAANARAIINNSVVAGTRSSELESVALENQIQDSDGIVELARLTATTDFDATIRVFDNSQVDSGVGSGRFDFGARQLPSEIRIEPNLTSATVLPDPGPTITRTIIVNRQAEGLVLQEQPIKQFGPMKPEAMEEQVSVRSLGTSSALTSAPVSSQTTLAKTSRPSVTIRTIDISQVRRNDIARPWLRSTVVQAPTRPRDFGFEKRQTIATPSSTTNLSSQPNTVGKSEKSAKWSSRVSSTRLQPVEFLLAQNDLETEKVAVLDGKPVVATDVAVSGYSYASRIDRLENEVFLEGLSASGLEIQTVPSRSEESNSQSNPTRDGSEAWVMAIATEMQRLAQYPPANANRDSWKSLVRSVSETTAGQAFLATLSTIAVQQKEVNAFGAKSAWEFVTRPNQSGQA